MKLANALLAALLWQGAGVPVPPPGHATESASEHMRYERALTLPNGLSGMACAVLDAETFAHAASPSANDLRVFRATSGEAPEEIPFALTESGVHLGDAAAARVENMGIRGGELDFDLAMPSRAYTTVDLQLAAQNFIATAQVSGSDGEGGPSTPLGSFVLFDLSEQHLARSTSIALQESAFPQLHIQLQVRGLRGEALPHLSEAMIDGASVPASREAQTVYTVVGSSHTSSRQGTATLWTIQAPAHVPIGRVSFVLDPAFKDSFVRAVSVKAGNAGDPARPQETVEGKIWRVMRDGGAGFPAIHAGKLTMDAVLASNLQDAVNITVALENGDEAALPIRDVRLEMRQRRICFVAPAGAAYTLRYGDAALRAPVYNSTGDSVGRVSLGSDPIVAELGPERVNADFRSTTEERSYTDRHPEVFWIGLLVAVAGLGATAMRSTR